MNPPLLEVALELRFDLPEVQPEKFQYSGNTEVNATHDCLLLTNNQGISFPALRDEWNTILTGYPVTEYKSVSLSYLNEIPLSDLQDFRDYLNINLDLPKTLNDRFEFFRSEFLFRYPFGEVKVWLQPDWDEEMEGYCIQLSLEARHIGILSRNNLMPKLHELHEGIKNVFHEVLSHSYLAQLPQ